MSILEVKNLKKSFDDTEVIRDISFSMEEGEAITIIGSSGSGKTTLLRCLNSLETPDSGEVIIDGEQINLPGTDVDRLRRKMGMVLKNERIFRKTS